MMTPAISIPNLRRELRASIGDRDKLSKLHSVLTDNISRSYGEEREMLLKFRQEVRDALNCRLDNL
jgi:hypothetical protein